MSFPAGLFSDVSVHLVIEVSIPILFTQLEKLQDATYYARARSQVEVVCKRIESLPTASEVLVQSWNHLLENVKDKRFEELDDHILPPDLERTRRCAVCNATAYSLGGGLMNCSRCQNRAYCSKTCQKMSVGIAATT